MADSISTDIAVQLDITARQGDTFVLELSVTDPDPAVTDTLDMTGLQHTGSSGTTDTSSVEKVIYGVKMSIADVNTGDIKLNLFTAYYGDQPFNESNNNLPTATAAGNYYGFGVAAGQPCIDLSATSSAAGKIKIKVPASYMEFEAGTYNYDLQVRYKEFEDLDAEITTWLFGTFRLNADVTQGTS